MAEEKLNMAEEKDFRRGELLEKYITKMLYGWNDRKFKEVEKELAKNRSQFLWRKNLKGGIMSN